MRKKIDYITNIKEEYYYNDKKQLIKVVYKDLEGNKIKEKENIYKNDRLVKRISETEEKEYYYDQWQNIGRESILLKEGEEKHFELKICYERNEIGQLEGKTCFVSRINNYEIEPSYQKLEECKEEYIYIGGGTNKLQYNNLVNKKRQPFNKEEEKVTYANSGQIVEIRDQENKIKKEYEYNYLAGTLKQEYNKEIGQVITYGYEDVNNFGGTLLRKKKYNLNYELEEDIEYLYEMPYIDLLKGIKVNNETKTFIYDEGLNLIQYADKKLKWKRGRLLESIEDKETKIEYQYDSNNIRVEKKEIKKAEITKYEVEGTRIISETKIKNNEEEYRIKYLYTEAEIIGFEIEQKNIRSYYIYEKDLEHNIVGLYEMNDYCGTRVASYIYDAYGNHKVLDKNKEENKAKNFIGNMNPIRYKGYYYDVETGLFFCNSRYYNPEWGRWISPDSIEYLDPESINGLNLYCYCMNDPINKYDPSGNFAISALLIAFGIGAVLGGVYGGISAAANGQDVGSGILIGAVVGGLTGLITEVASVPLMLLGTFAVGTGGDIASQMILDGKSFGEVNLLSATWAGVTNAGLSLVGKGLSIVDKMTGLTRAESIIFGTMINSPLIGLGMAINMGISKHTSVYTVNDLYNNTFGKNKQLVWRW